MNPNAKQSFFCPFLWTVRQKPVLVAYGVLRIASSPPFAEYIEAPMEVKVRRFSLWGLGKCLDVHGSCSVLGELNNVRRPCEPALWLAWFVLLDMSMLD